MGLTTDPTDECLKVIEPSGMQKCYLVLSEEERAKGFVRPLRRSYTHVGPAPAGFHPALDLRDLTPEEHERYDRFGYVKFEAYSALDTAVRGKFWTQAELDRIGKCGASTRMGLALCETYARQPDFYGATFCVRCRTHYPVREFVWDEDGAVVGS